LPPSDARRLGEALADYAPALTPNVPVRH
jgi:hypothetical protein